MKNHLTVCGVAAALALSASAILENAFGKGKSYFQCSAYPAMGHVTSEWEMMPNKWDFSAYDMLAIEFE